jgi:predicted small metal-binding protein
MADRMSRLGVDCKVVYVDPALTIAGDGETPATALKDLPAPAEWVKETVYLCRKTLSANIVNKLVGGECYFIAMPRKSEELFKSAPEAAQKAWGDDEIPENAFTVPYDGKLPVSFGPIQR